MEVQVTDKLRLSLERAASLPLRSISGEWDDPWGKYSIYVTYNVSLYDLETKYPDLKRFTSKMSTLAPVAPWLVFSSSKKVLDPYIKKVELFTSPMDMSINFLVEFQVSDLDKFSIILERIARDRYEQEFNNTVEQTLDGG